MQISAINIGKIEHIAIELNTGKSRGENRAGYDAQWLINTISVKIPRSSNMLSYIFYVDKWVGDKCKTVISIRRLELFLNCNLDINIFTSRSDNELNWQNFMAELWIFPTSNEDYSGYSNVKEFDCKMSSCLSSAFF